MCVYSIVVLLRIGGCRTKIAKPNSVRIHRQQSSVLSPLKSVEFFVMEWFVGFALYDLIRGEMEITHECHNLI